MMAPKFRSVRVLRAITRRYRLLRQPGRLSGSGRFVRSRWRRAI